jgi:hypothetical protein
LSVTLRHPAELPACTTGFAGNGTAASAIITTMAAKVGLRLEATINLYRLMRVVRVLIGRSDVM